MPLDILKILSPHAHTHTPTNTRQLRDLIFPLRVVLRTHPVSLQHLYWPHTMPLDGGAVIGLAVPSVGEIGYFQILNIVNNSTTNLPQACHSLAWVQRQGQKRLQASPSWLAKKRWQYLPESLKELNEITLAKCAANACSRKGAKDDYPGDHHHTTSYKSMFSPQ